MQRKLIALATATLLTLSLFALTGCGNSNTASTAPSPTPSVATSAPTDTPTPTPTATPSTSGSGGQTLIMPPPTGDDSSDVRFSQANVQAILDAFQKAGWTIDEDTTTATNSNLVDADGNQITKAIQIYSLHGEMMASEQTYPGETPPSSNTFVVYYLTEKLQLMLKTPGATKYSVINDYVAGCATGN